MDVALTSPDCTSTDAVELWCENRARFGIFRRCSAHECQGTLCERSRRCYEGEKPMGPEHRSSKCNGPARLGKGYCRRGRAEASRKGNAGHEALCAHPSGFGRCEAPLQHSTAPDFSVLQLNCSDCRCAKASKDRYYTRAAGADSHAKAVPKRTYICQQVR